MPILLHPIHNPRLYPWGSAAPRGQLKTLVHVEAKPHIDKPPGTPKVADGLAEQEFPGYLMEEVVSHAKQVSAEGKSATIG